MRHGARSSSSSPARLPALLLLPPPPPPPPAPRNLRPLAVPPPLPALPASPALATAGLSRGGGRAGTHRHRRLGRGSQETVAAIARPAAAREGHRNRPPRGPGRPSVARTTLRAGISTCEPWPLLPKRRAGSCRTCGILRQVFPPPSRRGGLSSPGFPPLRTSRGGRAEVGGSGSEETSGSGRGRGASTSPAPLLHAHPGSCHGPPTALSRVSPGIEPEAMSPTVR